MTHGSEPRQSGQRERPFHEQHAYRLLFGLALLALATGTVVYRVVEGWSWVDSFYFSSVTVTTVGFGDLAPTRDASKLFTVFYIFWGIGIISAFINERLKQRAGAMVKRAHKRRL
jgi:hypothetical protein